jgi:mannosylglycoprotein endo-beta-mannosidase
MRIRECLLVYATWLKCTIAKSASSYYVPLRWQLCKYQNNNTNTSNTTKYEQGIWLSRNGPDKEECIPAYVPGTVLSNLLTNGRFGFQDPYFETNLKQIPDISVTGRNAWTYFYVATWNIEEEEKHALLTLRSINYKAELWLDGTPILPRYFQGVPDPESIQGMFQRFSFPLGTLSAGQQHHVAILVHPPLHPGRPGGGQGGSHDLAKDGPVSQFTGGWDWIQATPDRNTGLWDKVSLKLSGPLQLRDPTVRIRNIDIDNCSADLYFSVSIDSRDDITSTQDDCALVSLQYHSDVMETNQGDPISVTRFLQVPIPSGARNVSADFPVETLTNAKLWYPHTHGLPALYQASFHIRKTPCNSSSADLLNDTNADISDDEASFRFGIRKVGFSLNTALNGLELTVNNEKVFLQGGNWIASDQLMRFAGDRTRYAAEVSLHKSMGLNMIRVWGGGITERPEFFDVCDELGMLVLSDFWMSGDNNGRWAGSDMWPLNHSLYLNAVRDTALLLRNHPSLVMYSAGNELYPLSKSPPPNIRYGIERELKKADPDTFLILSTMTNTSEFDPSESLCPKDGPYGMLEEALFYERNPGLWDWQNHINARLNDTKIAFQPEIGSSSFPPLSSLLRFISPESAKSFPGYQDANVHPSWDYHKFLGFTSQRKPFAKDQTENTKVDLIYQYGTPMNM